MTKIPIDEPKKPGIEHVILPPCSHYHKCDQCTLVDTHLDPWPGHIRLVISHVEGCECESRGQKYTWSALIPSGMKILTNEKIEPAKPDSE